jgi:hypothetical protein
MGARLDPYFVDQFLAALAHAGGDAREVAFFPKGLVRIHQTPPQLVAPRWRGTWRPLAFAVAGHCRSMAAHANFGGSSAVVIRAALDGTAYGRERQINNG